MEQDPNVLRQQHIEHLYSRKSLNQDIEAAILASPTNVKKISEGTKQLKNWLGMDFFPSKNARLKQIDPLNLRELVIDIFTGIAYYQTEELLVSACGQLAIKMGFDNHEDSIRTVSEMVGVLCYTDAYDIRKEHPMASMMVISKLELPDDIIARIKRSLYLPPMLCEPEYLEGNFDSAYLTFNDSLLLGQNNAHSEDICLDALNIQNNVALNINQEFLLAVEEEPNHELDTVEKLQLWTDFVQQSVEVYGLMLAGGNKFWLTNKYDKRGRMYAQGYHVTTQGSPYKKAMLEFSDKKMLEGIW